MNNLLPEWLLLVFGNFKLILSYGQGIVPKTVAKNGCDIRGRIAARLWLINFLCPKHLALPHVSNTPGALLVAMRQITSLPPFAFRLTLVFMPIR